MAQKLRQVRSLLLIALGVAMYTFGFVKFNMANALAEGGVAGVTLIIHALYKIDPAYTSLILNIPLFIADQADRLIGLALEQVVTTC